MGPIYQRAGGPTTELWALDDTAHTQGLSSHRSQYENRVLDLFERSLFAQR
jgi:hypothetical protein